MELGGIRMNHGRTAEYAKVGCGGNPEGTSFFRFSPAEERMNIFVSKTEVTRWRGKPDMKCSRPMF
jgi:hypothetical protein